MKYYKCDICGNTFDGQAFGSYQIAYSLDGTLRRVVEVDICEECAPRTALTQNERTQINDAVEAGFHKAVYNIAYERLEQREDTGSGE